jgi:ATP-dependent DNA ligase
VVAPKPRGYHARHAPWFPPAPAPGPASILSLPPDDWVMQPKIDGIRVIIYRREPFTRFGQRLSRSKRAAVLREMFAGVSETLDGEWVPKEGKYYAFRSARRGWRL